MLSYKARVGKPINPRNPTRSCSRCGGTKKAPKGAVCGLRVERQLNAAVNLYLQMEGFPHDPGWFDRVVGGFALTGEEADEGSNEPWRSPAFESQELCKSIKDYIAQNPYYQFSTTIQGMRVESSLPL